MQNWWRCYLQTGPQCKLANELHAATTAGGQRRAEISGAYYRRWSAGSPGPVRSEITIDRCSPTYKTTMWAELTAVRRRLIKPNSSRGSHEMALRSPPETVDRKTRRAIIEQPPDRLVLLTRRMSLHTFSHPSRVSVMKCCCMSHRHEPGCIIYTTGRGYRTIKAKQLQRYVE